MMFGRTMTRKAAVAIVWIALVPALLSGCNFGQDPIIHEQNVAEEAADAELDTGDQPINEPPGDQVPPSQNKVLLMATWTRVDLIVDGEPCLFEPATLVLQEGTFVGTGACTTHGTLSAEEETFTMVMTESNCPQAILPLTITYNYQIADDGMTLITQTGNVVEIFSKVP
jgi:hypothetical protein